LPKSLFTWPKTFLINIRPVSSPPRAGKLARKIPLQAAFKLLQGSGYFFHDKMPGCRLPSLAAVTTLQFTTGDLQLSLKQEPTPCFAFLGGNSPLPI
jgi:hypothetical protein